MERKDFMVSCGIIVLACFCIVVFTILLCSFTTIPAGHVGVLTTFGAVDNTPFPEGFNLKSPLKAVQKISVRTWEYRADGDVPTKDGLGVHLEVSLLYSIKPAEAPAIYKKYGANYDLVIIVPLFRSLIRDATSHYRAEDLFTANRQKIESDLFKETKALLESEGIVVEKVLLREVKLPVVVQKAIEQKLSMDQAAQQMEFTIRKEKLEADRKRVEAAGIADSQKIIQDTLNEKYLKYLWIMALKEHSGAIIYVPTASDGMPIFKNVDDHKKN